LSIFPRQARRQCRKCVLNVLHILRKFLEHDLGGAVKLINMKKDLWYDLRTVYPDLCGNNRELGSMIQLVQDTEKTPNAADKALMRLSLHNFYNTIPRDQKVMQFELMMKLDPIAKFDPNCEMARNII